MTRCRNITGLPQKTLKPYPRGGFPRIERERRGARKRRKDYDGVQRKEGKRGEIEEREGQSRKERFR